MNEKVMTADDILRCGISAGYNINIAKEFGINEAIILNRIAYLTAQTKRSDGFVWQTEKDWITYTALSGRQVKYAVTGLIKKGILTKKVTYILGTKKRATHYRLNTHFVGPEGNKMSASGTNKMCVSVNNIEHSIELSNTNQPAAGDTKRKKSDFQLLIEELCLILSIDVSKLNWAAAGRWYKEGLASNCNADDFREAARAMKKAHDNDGITVSLQKVLTNTAVWLDREGKGDKFSW